MSHFYLINAELTWRLESLMSCTRTNYSHWHPNSDQQSQQHVASGKWYAPCPRYITRLHKLPNTCFVNNDPCFHYHLTATSKHAKDFSNKTSSFRIMCIIMFQVCSYFVWSDRDTGRISMAIWRQLWGHLYTYVRKSKTLSKITFYSQICYVTEIIPKILSLSFHMCVRMIIKSIWYLEIIISK